MRAHRPRSSSWLSGLCAVLAGLLPTLPSRLARAEGWVAALTELRAAPDDLRDVRRPLPQRVAQARALGAFGPAADAVPTLLQTLHGKLQPALRDEILLALAKRASPAASAALIALLERDEAPPPALATALSAIGDKASLAALTAALARPKAAAAAERALLDAGRAAAAPLSQAVSSVIALRAARLLGRLGPRATASSLAALLRALSSESPELRAVAAESLGRLGDERSAEPLLALLSDASPQVVIAALRALAMVATRAQAQRLAAFFARANPAQRPPALAAVAMADPDASVGLLDRAVTSSEPALRQAAVRILEGARPHPSFVAGLGRLFQLELRADTASALSRVADGAGVASLIGAARRSPDATQRAARALALGLRRFEAKLPANTVRDGRALLRSLPPGERRMLLCALARDPSVLGTATAALSFESASERATAARALGLLGDARAASALLSALALERDAEATRRMLEAALELELRVPLAALWRLLRDPETAPEAMPLAVAGADPVAPARALRVFLRRVLSSHRPTRMRVAAALALAALADRGARPALEAVLADASPRVRLAAVRALASLGGASAARALVVQTRVERDPLVRRAALQAVAHAGAAAPLVARGELALELRVRTQAGSGDDRPMLEVLLEDGRWLRLRALAGGELIVSDLTAGQADVRAVD